MSIGEISLVVISKTHCIKRETINTAHFKEECGIHKIKWGKQECNGCQEFCDECRRGICYLTEIRRGLNPHYFLHQHVMPCLHNEKNNKNHEQLNAITG